MIFDSFCDFHDKIMSYLSDDRFSSLGRYFLLWSETSNSFCLSIKSFDSTFDSSLIHDLIEYLPYIRETFLSTSDDCIVLVLLFDRNS